MVSVLERPFTTLFVGKQVYLDDPRYKCQVSPKEQASFQKCHVNIDLQMIAAHTLHNPIWVGTFGLAKKSPYTPFMSFFITNMTEHGILSELKTANLNDGQDCSEYGLTETALTFKKTVSLFVVLLFGICLAILLFILEILFNTFSPSSDDHQGLKTKTDVIDKEINDAIFSIGRLKDKLAIHSREKDPLLEYLYDELTRKFKSKLKQ